MINAIANRISRELEQIQSFCVENGMKEYRLVEIQYKGEDSELIYIVSPKNDPKAEVMIISGLTVKNSNSNIIPIEDKLRQHIVKGIHRQVMG